MKLYIIERFIKRKWQALSFVQTSDSEEVGVSLRIYPAIGQTEERTLKVLAIARERFPGTRFRVSLYERSKTQKT